MPKRLATPALWLDLKALLQAVWQLSSYRKSCIQLDFKKVKVKVLTVFGGWSEGGCTRPIAFDVRPLTPKPARFYSVPTAPLPSLRCPLSVSHGSPSLLAISRLAKYF